MTAYTVVTKRRPCMVRHLRETYYLAQNPLRRLYWQLVRPRTHGAKAIVTCGEKLLLVRLGYAHQGWVIPGGGVNRGESFAAAARRELREETGVIAPALTYIGRRDYQKEFKLDTVHYFHTELAALADIIIDDQEIKDAGWFLMDALPEPHPPRLAETITLFKTWNYGA